MVGTMALNPHGFMTMTEEEMFAMDGGVISFGVGLLIGLGVGILVEGTTKAANGKSASDHVASAITTVVKSIPGSFDNKRVGNW